MWGGRDRRKAHCSLSAVVIITGEFKLSFPTTCFVYKCHREWAKNSLNFTSVVKGRSKPSCMGPIDVFSRL
jgi:hypothetical protein